MRLFGFQLKLRQLGRHTGIQAGTVYRRAADGSGDCSGGPRIERTNDGALIALAFVFLGLIGQFELAAVVDGVQTFEWQGRS